jgi:carbon starvation protein
LLGNIWRPIGRTSWYPSVLICSALVVAGWGYFLYFGTLDPLGGINSLWPLFGIANQMLAAIALCVATTVLVKSGRVRFAWVTVLPLTWLVAVTTTAAWQKLFSPDTRVGFLSHANDLAAQLEAGTLTGAAASQAPQLIFNDRLDAALTLFFLITVWVLIFETARVCYARLSGGRCPPLAETPHVQTRLAEG